MSDAILKHCFPPIVDERTRVLVLGSLPGEQSLAAGQYYANPRNQFWRLIGALIGQEIAGLPYEERLQALLRSRIGLWDTVASAVRAGSLDAAIRDHQPNHLSELATRLPGLRAIAFNGRKSAAIGRAVLAEDEGLDLIDLPSSSPAFTLPFEAKLEQWRSILRWL